MGSTLKRISRKEEVARRKSSNKAMKLVTQSIINMPKSCAMCKAHFDPKSPGALDTWHVKMSKVNTVKSFLICPNCWHEEESVMIETTNSGSIV